MEYALFYLVGSAFPMRRGAALAVIVPESKARNAETKPSSPIPRAPREEAKGFLALNDQTCDFFDR